MILKPTLVAADCYLWCCQTKENPFVIVKTDPSEQNWYSDTKLPKDLGLKNVKNPT